MNVYIPTCDSHLFVLKAFAYCFNKYCGETFNVKILGFTAPDFPLPANFEFISLGKSQEGGAKGWTNYLIDFFDNIEDEYFIFGIDDFCVCRPFDFNIYHALLKELSPQLGRIDLQPSIQYCRHAADVKVYKKCEDFEILELSQSPAYDYLNWRITGQFSIWNRDYFLKNMHRNWSPHDWELTGSKLAENDGYSILGTKDKWCIKKVELLSDAQYPNKINIRGMRDEDIEVIRSMYEDREEEIGFFKDEWVKIPGWESVIYGD